MGKSLKTSQRTIAAVSVASLALLNVGIMAPAAYADISANGAAPSDVATTNMPNEVQLKIHKLTPDENTSKKKGEEGAYKRNGTAEEGTPGTEALEGVQFTIYKIDGIDLTTNAGWEKAKEVSKKFNGLSAADRNKLITDDASKVDLGTGISVNKSVTANAKTGADGIVNFNVSGAERGMYVVYETMADGDSVKVYPKNDNGEGFKTEASKTVTGADIQKAAPFVVALPMTNQGQTDQWLNVVNVYPKNSLTGVEKTVEDVAAPGSGNSADEQGASTSDITYTIKTDIPQNLGADELENYQIVDPLDSRLEYRSSELSLVGSSEALTEVKDGAGDYEIVVADGSGPDPASPEGEEDTIGKVITIQFTEQGRKKLINSGASQVQWKLNARVGDTQAGETTAASIENKAWLIPNQPSNPWNPNEPTPKIPGKPSTAVKSKYGKVTISKVAKGTEDALGGATFQLYTCKLDDQGKPVIDEVNGRVSVDGKNEWTTAYETNADQGKVKGQVSIDGLQLNDFVNGKKVTADTLAEAREKATDAGRNAAKALTNTHYCLKETKAPAGYELLPEPVAFQLTEEGSNEVITKKIENVPNNGGFELPLTGGKGIFGLIALGALLVLGSIGYIFFASRRQES